MSHAIAASAGVRYCPLCLLCEYMLIIALYTRTSLTCRAAMGLYDNETASSARPKKGGDGPGQGMEGAI